MEIGLRYWDGAAVVEIPVDSDYASHALRIAKNGVVYGMPTLDISSPDAHPIRIQTPAGVKALGLSSAVVTPDATISSITFFVNDIFRDWDVVYGTITVIDAVTLLPYPNATIEAQWSGPYNGFQTFVTNGSGVANQFLTA